MDVITPEQGGGGPGQPPPPKTPQEEAPAVPGGVDQVPAEERAAPLPGGELTQPVETPVETPTTQTAQTEPPATLPDAPEIAPDTGVGGEPPVNPATYPNAQSLEEAVGGSLPKAEAGPKPGAIDMTPEQHQALKPEAPRSEEDIIIDNIVRLRSEVDQANDKIKRSLDEIEGLMKKYESLRTTPEGLPKTSKPPETPEPLGGENK